MIASKLSRLWLAIAIAIASPYGIALAGGITLAHPYQEGGAVDIWARNLKACLENGGELYIDVVGGGSLGRGAELAEAVSQGNVDIAILPAGTLARFWPELSRLGQSEPIFDPRELLRLSRSGSFLTALNTAGGEKLGIAALSVGWQFSLLAATNGRLDDGALGGARFFVPARTPSGSEPYSDFLQDVIRTAGAEVALFDARDVEEALLFGAVDGAVVEPQTVLHMMETGMLAKADPLQLQWSEDFVPLSSALVVIMNTRSYAYEMVSREMMMDPGWADRCLPAAEAFSAEAIRGVQDVVERARSYGVQVVDATPAWRDAFAQAIAVRQQPGDAVAEAVRAELGR